MKALTVYQPYAQLMVIGAKTFETRGWATNYRGPIAIHAARKDASEVFERLPVDVAVEIIRALGFKALGGKIPEISRMAKGYVIATAELTGCYRVVRRDNKSVICSPMLEITGKELLFGDFTPGRFAWKYENVKLLERPVPVSGQQGLWNWDPQEQEEK